MKLVEIKDVRVGQIWKRENEYRLIVSFDDEPKNIAGNSFYAEYGGNINLVSDFEDMFSLKDIVSTHSLIGFLGITHEIKDNKLVEIPNVFENAKINSDDIVIIHGDDDTPFLVASTYNPNKYDAYISLLSYHEGEFSEDEVEKIGTLGVTHEFVNERLVK